MKQKRKNESFLRLAKKSYLDFQSIIKKQVSTIINNIKNLAEKSYEDLKKIVDFIHLNIKKLEHHVEIDIKENIKEILKEPLTTGAFLNLLTVNTALVEVFKELQKEINILNIAKKIVSLDQQNSLFKHPQINYLFDRFEDINNKIKKETKLEKIYEYEKEKKQITDSLISNIKTTLNNKKMTPENQKILNEVFNKLTNAEEKERNKIIKRLNNAREYFKDNTRDNKIRLSLIHYLDKDDLKKTFFSLFKIKTQLAIESFVVSTIFMGSLAYINPTFHNNIKHIRENLNQVEQRYVPSLLRHVIFENEHEHDNENEHNQKKPDPSKYFQRVIIIRTNKDEDKQKHIKNKTKTKKISKKEISFD